MEIKHRYLLPFLLALLLTSVHAQNIQNDSLLDGYLSYQKGDWTNAAFFLRKAATDPSVSNDSVWYMIIMSEMNMEKFSNALSDCNYFMQTFNDSSLLPNVKYQRGRILHYVGQNDNAVLELSDFCHENPESPVYSSALFWIAECFYEDYSFETAKTLYERVVSEFPESSQVADSLFKISFICIFFIADGVEELREADTRRPRQHYVFRSFFKLCRKSIHGQVLVRPSADDYRRIFK